MNNHQLGCRRDRLVIETLQEWGTMDTEQIRIRFFPSLRVAQRRLQGLIKKGRLKRTQEAIGIPYSYYLKRYNPERIALNWIRLWIQSRLKSWEIIDSFNYETNTCFIRNTVTSTVKTYNVFYNVSRKIWIDGEVIVVYDTDGQKTEAAKRINGILLTIEEIKGGLKCSKNLS